MKFSSEFKFIDLDRKFDVDLSFRRWILTQRDVRQGEDITDCRIARIKCERPGWRGGDGRC